MADLFTVELSIDPSGAVTGSAKFKDATDAAGDAASNMGKKVKSGVEDSNTALSKLKDSLGDLAGLIGAAFTVDKIYEFARGAVEAGAQYAALGATLAIVGGQAGYTADQLDAAQVAIEANDVSMQDARAATQRLVTAHIDLADAAKFSAAAQDIAAITGGHFIETQNQLILAVQTGMERSLKAAGVFVDLKRAVQDYADANVVAVSDLSQMTLEHIRLQAVLAATAEKQGAYEAKLQTSEGQMEIFHERVANIKTALGAAFDVGNFSALSILNGWLQDGINFMHQHASAVVVVIDVLKGLAVTVGVIVAAFIAWKTYTTAVTIATIALEAATGNIAAAAAGMLALGAGFLTTTALLAQSKKDTESFTATLAGLQAGAVKTSTAVHGDAGSLSAAISAANLKFKEGLPAMQEHLAATERITQAYLSGGPAAGKLQEQTEKYNEELVKASSTLSGHMKTTALALIASQQLASAQEAEAKATADARVAHMAAYLALKDQLAVSQMAVQMQSGSMVDASVAITRAQERETLVRKAATDTIVAEMSLKGDVLVQTKASIDANERLSLSLLDQKNRYDDIKTALAAHNQDLATALDNTHTYATALLTQSDSMTHVFGVTQQMTKALADLKVNQDAETAALAARTSIQDPVALKNRLDQIEATRTLGLTINDLNDAYQREDTAMAPIKNAVSSIETAFGQFFANVVTQGTNAFQALGNALKAALLQAISDSVVTTIKAKIADIQKAASSSSNDNSNNKTAQSAQAGSSSLGILGAIVGAMAGFVASDIARSNAEEKARQALIDFTDAAVKAAHAMSPLASSIKTLQDAEAAAIAAVKKAQAEGDYKPSVTGTWKPGEPRTEAENQKVSDETATAKLAEITAGYAAQLAAIAKGVAQSIEQAYNSAFGNDFQNQIDSARAAADNAYKQIIDEITAGLIDQHTFDDLAGKIRDTLSKTLDNIAKAVQNAANQEADTQANLRVRIETANNDPRAAEDRRHAQEQQELDQLVANGASDAVIALTKLAQAAEDAASAQAAAAAAQQATEDLTVRDLRATGHGAEADMQSFVDKQAAELKAAQDAHQSDDYIKLLLKTQADELTQFQQQQQGPALTDSTGASAASVVGGGVNGNIGTTTAITSASYEQAANTNSLLMSANVWLSQIYQVLATGAVGAASSVGGVVSGDPNAVLGRAVSYSRAAAGSIRT